jgi:hypothetical protein
MLGRDKKGVMLSGSEASARIDKPYGEGFSLDYGMLQTCGRSFRQAPPDLPQVGGVKPPEGSA